MSNWRRQYPRNNKNNCYNHQRGMTMTQSSSKPPLFPVPAWEKDFCAVIGSVPWGKVVEAKRFMHLYDRVVQWDDSAGEDAFKNAKSRFYAEMNDLPCDLSIPGPDVYIDDVDWDAEVDTELIVDLERGPEPRTKEEQEHVVILDPMNLLGYSGVGWGIGWGDAEGINEENVGKQENSWDDQKCDGWNDDSWVMKDTTESWDHNNNSFKTKTWQHNNNSFKTESWHHKKSINNSFNQHKFDNWNGRDQGRGWRKKGDARRGVADRVVDCRWRNGRGRSRGGFQQPSNGSGWTESF